MKKRTTIILLILIFTIYASNTNVQINAEENNYRLTLLELTPHDPISITSDSDFEVFPGLGTSENPYLIDGYNITTTSTNGINIRGTTKYFTVRNCYIDADSDGIYIENVADGTATVINNTCINNAYGIEIWDSVSSTVINNTCINNGFKGIMLSFSVSSTVTNNIFTNCGLCINEDNTDAYISYTVENNWVNGKKLGFYTNLDSTIIAEPIYGQLILVNCTNMTVRDQILNNATIGLFLCSCTSSAIINNICNNGDYGIYLYSSGSSTISNNTCSNNWFSISLVYSGSSTVANNTCSNNHWSGICLGHSGSSTVANNTCSNNGYGIKLDYSSSSIVTNNTCNNNNYWGILLYSSDFCVVAYNLLQENEYYGVCLGLDSDNILIHHNTFVDNNIGGTSQAWDAGANNFWYDTATLEGNYWSDWSGTGSYVIDGSAGLEDLYPLDEPAEYSVESTTDENPLSFTFTLLIVVVPLMLTRIISRKAKKNRTAVRNIIET